MDALAKTRTSWILGGVVFFLLLTYPLLQIFNLDTIIWGIPLLVLYLHGVWLGAIVVLYALGRRLTSRE